MKLCSLQSFNIQSMISNQFSFQIFAGNKKPVKMDSVIFEKLNCCW